MKQFSLTELNQRPGKVVHAASAAPVHLTKNGVAAYVVMTVEEFDKRSGANNPQRAYRWGEGPAEIEALFAGELDRMAKGEGYDDPI